MEQKQNKSVGLAAIGFCVAAVLFIFGGCNSLGGGPSDSVRIVQAEEATNQYAIRQLTLSKMACEIMESCRGEK